MITVNLNSSHPLAGRHALVTGGARGIGSAIVQVLAAAGAHVFITDIDGDLTATVAADMCAHGLNVSAIKCDVANEQDISTLAARLQATAGQLDILINNAAILDATPLSQLTRARFEKVQQINQNSALWMTIAVLPMLRNSTQARIVNIGSIIGPRGAIDSLSYGTAKGGLIAMTRALAIDLAPEGILVNCICPGFVDTRMALLPDGTGHEHETDWFRDIYIKYGRIPLRRPAAPMDIAKAVYCFCGDSCTYITGQALMVDGGLSATF